VSLICPELGSATQPRTADDSEEETTVPAGALDDEQIMTLTLEAFADTIIPGEKRSADDLAIAGVATGGGAVASGALELLADPATGVTDGLGPLSQALNGHAQAYAAEQGLELDGEVPAFVALPYEHRAALIQRLTTPGHPEKEGWVLLALFSNMAFDVAAHLHTAEAIAAGHPGLTAMGFAKPDADGLWRFPEYSYRRPLADLHPNTIPSGSLG
jgi:enediyne biosynthesis protein E8